MRTLLQRQRSRVAVGDEWRKVFDGLRTTLHGCDTFVETADTTLASGLVFELRVYLGSGLVCI